MRKYIIRRLLLAIPVLLLASLVVFGLMRVMPGDALTALMAESGNVSERELQKLHKDLGHPFGTDDIGRDILSRVI